jgi:hypothetical protein
MSATSFSLGQYEAHVTEHDSLADSWRWLVRVKNSSIVYRQGQEATKAGAMQAGMDAIKSLPIVPRRPGTIMTTFRGCLFCRRCFLLRS